MTRLAGRNVGLDGVPAQQANYRKSGFRLAWNNIRHEGAAARRQAARRRQPGRCAQRCRSTGSRPTTAASSPRRATVFLAPWITLPERAALVALRDGELAGFAVMRAVPDGVARRAALTPTSPEIAAALVSALAAKMGAKAVAIDVPDINKPGVALVEAAGMKPSFETARMYTGADPEVDYAGLFGVTSFELG